MMEDKTASLKEVLVTRPVVAVAALLALVSFGRADDPPSVQWHREFTGKGVASGYWVDCTPDGGYMVIGNTWAHDDAGETSIALYIVKTDSNGVMMWQRTVDAGCNAVAYSGLPLLDGGYLVAGVGGIKPSPESLSNEQPFMAKFDSAGNELWRRSYALESFGWGYHLVRAHDGGYVLSCVNPCRDSGLYVMKVDSLGTAVWCKAYPVSYGLSFDFVGLAATEDGGYIVAARNLVKVDSTGECIWSRVYDGVTAVRSIVAAQDSGFAATGVGRYGVGPERSDSCSMMLLRIRPNGEQVWARDIAGSATRGGQMVCLLADGGYAVAGTACPREGPCLSGLVVRTGADGSPVWRRLLTNSASSGAVCLRPTMDGGLVVAGWTADTSANSLGERMSLWKLAPESR